jgi:hypothetical protein
MKAQVLTLRANAAITRGAGHRSSIVILVPHLSQFRENVSVPICGNCLESLSAQRWLVKLEYTFSGICGVYKYVVKQTEESKLTGTSAPITLHI